MINRASAFAALQVLKLAVVVRQLHCFPQTLFRRSVWMLRSVAHEVVTLGGDLLEIVHVVVR